MLIELLITALLIIKLVLYILNMQGIQYIYIN